MRYDTYGLYKTYNSQFAKSIIGTSFYRYLLIMERYIIANMKKQKVIKYFRTVEIISIISLLPFKARLKASADNPHQRKPLKIRYFFELLAYFGRFLHSNICFYML